MNHPIRTSLSLRAAAAACALGVTAFGLVGVDGLAQKRSVSPYAQIVQLERVVVTGQRLNAATTKDIVVADAACMTSARSAAAAPC
jgi:hypothetical protein